MASVLIHMVVADELNKRLKRDRNSLLIGSVAPDIAKHLGQTKVASHFLDRSENPEDDIPIMEWFLSKYKNFLYDDFVMGYFIHLYTDYLWFKYFIPEIYDKDIVTKLDGTKVKCEGKMINQYIYNDYSNLNEQLLKHYNFDHSFLSEKHPLFDNIITEIPMEKIQVIIDKTKDIIDNSKIHKDFIFNFEHIENFIDLCVSLTLSKIEELNLI